MKLPAILLAACVLTSCSQAPRARDPHELLNPSSERDIHAYFGQVSYETRFDTLAVSNSHWVVVSAYPYRSLNRFDVLVFEHPAGGKLSYDYGYYSLRAFLVVSHSNGMRVAVTPDRGWNSYLA